MQKRFQDISDEIRKNIDNYCQTEYDDGFRTHLGASLIGHNCKAFLWFTFRWVYHYKFSGRMQRLFNTGHKEEARIIEWLQGAGYNVSFQDENGKQFKISNVEGHFGGSIDGIVNIPALGNCLLECKTNKDGADYEILFENNLQIAKPKHWSQTCTYGSQLGLTHAIYINKNKNNDDLYIEPVELNWKHGEENINKAREIIYSEVVPAKLSTTAAYWECKNCNFVDICHRGKAIQKNCRSCKFAMPGPNASWHCRKWNSEIPKEHIANGCDAWEGLL